jgi:hypothetical protein
MGTAYGCCLRLQRGYNSSNTEALNRVNGTISRKLIFSLNYATL